MVATIRISKPRSGLSVPRFWNSGKNAAHRSDDPDFEATIWLIGATILEFWEEYGASKRRSRFRSHDRAYPFHDSGILGRIRRIEATIPISKPRSGLSVPRFWNSEKNAAHRSDDPDFVAMSRLIGATILEFWEECGASWRRSRFRRYDPPHSSYNSGIKSLLFCRVATECQGNRVRLSGFASSWAYRLNVF